MLSVGVIDLNSLFNGYYVSNEWSCDIGIDIYRENNILESSQDGIAK